MNNISVKILLAAMCFSLFQTAGYGKPDPKESWLNDQVDQTDIYAIPLDTSEEEEQQEMNQLKKEQRRSNVKPESSKYPKTQAK